MVAQSLSTEQLEHLRRQLQKYSQGRHYRVNSLTQRRLAHALIRELTSPENLPTLSLDDFDRHIWQSGRIRLGNRAIPWSESRQLLVETQPSRFTAMLDSGEISFVGNMTWSSAAATLRAYARGRSRSELETEMRDAIAVLLHESGSIEDRLSRVRDLRIGFGRNVCSGLLAVWHPKEYILYNSVSEQYWARYDFHFPPGANWVKGYLGYNSFSKALLSDPALGLEDLVDLDTFMFWCSEIESPLPKEARQPKSRPKRPTSAGHGGITLAQLQATRRDMSADRFRATWGQLYDQLVAEELSKTATDISKADVGRRACQYLDEIHDFLHGKLASSPQSYVICDWIHFCYALGLYREAAALVPYVREDEVDPAIYKRAIRVAEVCRTKVGLTGESHSVWESFDRRGAAGGRRQDLGNSKRL